MAIWIVVFGEMVDFASYKMVIVHSQWKLLLFKMIQPANQQYHDDFEILEWSNQQTSNILMILKF